MNIQLVQCPVCRCVDQLTEFEFTRAREGPNHGMSVIECKRCGAYEIDSDFGHQIPEGLEKHLGLRLSGLARERIAAGAELLQIRLNDELDSLASAAELPRRGVGYLHRALELIASRSMYPGTGCIWPLGEFAARLYMPINAVPDLLQQLEHDRVIEWRGGKNQRTADIPRHCRCHRVEA